MRGFRRYRAFVVFAAIALLILYRVSFSTEDSWDALTSVGSSSGSSNVDKTPPKVNTPPDNTNSRPDPKPFVEDDHSKPKIPETPAVDNTGSKSDTYNPKGAVTAGKPSTNDDDDDLASKTKQQLVDGTKSDKTQAGSHDETFNIPDRIIDQNGHNQEATKAKAQDALKPTPTHWSKPIEHFPVPAASLIPLPAGKPQKIPTIQFSFGKESAEAQKLRESRLAKVKAEAVRAWKGYRKYAFGHDELSPVTKRYRDPFCGWAATLVDSLDTLWIMGLKEEFEEAVQAVGEIDFTTTPKREIPVFETTIRYLGGLLAAYDVSGGKSVASHKILLEKAVELAEILMGVFDTPNRMPVLYYNWRPAAMALKRRASSGSNMAEFGSLSMEFTRLAQLTNDNKYYDAVARITNALEEWQNRGTTLPGIFPDNVDASGCNRTAETERLAFNADGSPAKIAELKSSVYLEQGDQRAKAKGFSVEQDELAVSNHNHQEPVPGGSDAVGSSKLSRRSNSASEYWDPTAMTSTSDVDCVPQGLAPGGHSEAYGMGGGQDSTYEYFPKQYLLLGGLEPKYKTMHLKVAAAVKKWLLYRPMVPDDRDLLFSAKLTTRGDPAKDAITEYEVTHLTCFLGGMFGMAGKIFDQQDDVEIGKRLADGCVWAYESTPSGIMPEGAYVVPCENVNKCEFNQTLWWQTLDPLAAKRDAQLADYYKRVEELKAARKQSGQSTGEEDSTNHKFRVSHSNTKDDQDTDDDWQAAAKLDAAEKLRNSKLAGSSNSVKRSALPPTIPEHNADRAGLSSGRFNDEDQIPLDMTLPARPQSHKEYVQNRIEVESLPPGFTDIRFPSYILRPEAIESVWYMYRITGDKTWQDKGWKMWEAIIRHTQTESGHSAIYNVMRSNPDKKDEMESFWLAETLKYFYLLYSTPDVISLDEWVLNTEAHPFRRPS